ncbi:hypothetical protein SAMD00019534_058040 [Acytostelium subglobosum LB1]|uniref:hypothetical protein n=1 Tax=Acytostelium subglobosum LB1 TaxID=1410327 RepID=UPI000644B6FA|nr:hypothetical protein SAMD00019534_058040 [Acytostelium subglobosum LB1]GAM22629.1 hypothetical protein SAMD00019534_058040 [Acytostelium subglobosum LB1]|eukprot:XP_012754749.1 hypothetical protein SAMD00019534_058040 [Acytostelium subglobosum LB1]
MEVGCLQVIDLSNQEEEEEEEATDYYDSQSQQSLYQFLENGCTLLFIKHFKELTNLIEPHLSLVDAEEDDWEEEENEERLLNNMRPDGRPFISHTRVPRGIENVLRPKNKPTGNIVDRLVALAISHRNREVLQVLFDYNVQLDQVHANHLFAEHINATIKNNDADFLAFILQASSRHQHENHIHPITLDQINWQDIDDYSIFTLLFGSIRRLRFTSLPIFKSFQPNLITSIGSPENALVFVQSIFVLWSCLDVDHGIEILVATLTHYMNTEILDVVHQHCPSLFTKKELAPALATLSTYTKYQTFIASKQIAQVIPLGVIFEHACINGDIQLMQQMITSSSSVTNILSPLENALHYSTLDIVTWLLDNNDINVEDNEGFVEWIPPSIQSLALIQRLLSFPNIKFKQRSFESLAVAHNYFLLEYLDVHLEQSRREYLFVFQKESHHITLDYTDLLLECLKANLPNSSITPSFVAGYLARHPDVVIDYQMLRLAFTASVQVGQQVLNHIPQPLDLTDLSLISYGMTNHLDLLKQWLVSDTYVFKPVYKQGTTSAHQLVHLSTS